MNPSPFAQSVVDAESIPWTLVGQGLRRKVLTYDANLMLVLVEFEPGAVGALHQHPHVQMSYVQRGSFAITIGDETRVLIAGDAFHVPSDVLHGAICQEAGTLLDVFSPMRADFV